MTFLDDSCSRRTGRDGTELVTGMPSPSALAAEVRPYFRAGWPVAPGSWWDPDGERHRCGRACCQRPELHVVDCALPPDSREQCRAPAPIAAMTSTDEVTGIWLRHPYTPLLLTGSTVHALEGDVHAVGPVVRQLHRERVWAPVAALRPGRMLVLTEPFSNRDLEWELVTRGVVHHATGAWVPLPPGTVEGCAVRWIRTPREARWQLPTTAATLTALYAVVDQSKAPSASCLNLPTTRSQALTSPPDE